MKRTVLALLVLLLPVHTSSQEWYSEGDLSGIHRRVLDPQIPVLYYDFTANVDPKMVTVDPSCSVSVCLNPDEDGANTGTEIQVYDCDEDADSWSSASCRLISVVDVNGIVQDTIDGDTIGQRCFYGLNNRFLGVDVSAVTGDDARVTVGCHP